MLTNYLIYYVTFTLVVSYSAKSQRQDPIVEKVIEPCVSFTAYNMKEETLLDCWLSCDAVCSQFFGYLNPQKRPICYEKESKSDYEIASNDTCGCGKYFTRGSESLWKPCNPPVRYNVVNENLCEEHCQRLFVYTYEHRGAMQIKQCSFTQNSNNATPLRGACTVGKRNEFICECGLTPLENTNAEKLVKYSEQEKKLQTLERRMDRNRFGRSGTTTNEGANNFVRARKNVEIGVKSSKRFNLKLEASDKTRAMKNTALLNKDTVTMEAIRLLKNVNGSITDDLSMFRECRYLSQSMEMGNGTMIRCLDACSKNCATLRGFRDKNEKIVCFDKTAPVKAVYKKENDKKCDCQVIPNEESTPITCNDRISKYHVSKARCENECNSLTGFLLSRKGNQDIVTGCASKRKILTQPLVTACERRNELNVKCACGLLFKKPSIIISNGESPSKTATKFPNTSPPRKHLDTARVYSERNNLASKKYEKGGSRNFGNDLKANKLEIFNKSFRESRKKNEEKLRSIDKFSPGKSKNLERDFPSVSESLISHKKGSTFDPSIDNRKNLQKEKNAHLLENPSLNNSASEIARRNNNAPDNRPIRVNKKDNPRINSPSFRDKNLFAKSNDELGIYTRPSTSKNTEIIFCNDSNAQSRPKENASNGSSNPSKSLEKIVTNSSTTPGNKLWENQQVGRNSTPKTVSPIGKTECCKRKEGNNSRISRDDLDKAKYKEKIPNLSITVNEKNPLICKSIQKANAGVSSPVKRKMILQPLSDEETDNAEILTKTANQTELRNSKINNVEMQPKRFKTKLASANENEINANASIAEKRDPILEKNNFKRTLSRTDIVGSDEQSVAKKTYSHSSSPEFYNRQTLQKSSSFSAIEGKRGAENDCNAEKTIPEKFARRREKFTTALEALKAQTTHPRKCRTPRSKATQISPSERLIGNNDRTSLESPIVTLPNYNEEDNSKVTIDDVVWKNIDEIDFCDETQWQEIIQKLTL